MAKKKKTIRKNEYEGLIINRPEALSAVRRSTEWGVTSIGWIVWIFFFRPVLLILLWYLGFKFFYRHMVALKGLQGLIEMWKLYFGTILIILLCIQGWSVYNKVKFRRKDRRQNVRSMSREDIEEFFRFAEKNSSEIQSWDDIEVDFNKKNKILIHKAGGRKEPFQGHFSPT